jgi:hypothetical protein
MSPKASSRTFLVQVLISYICPNLFSHNPKPKSTLAYYPKIFSVIFPTLILLLVYHFAPSPYFPIFPLFPTVHTTQLPLLLPLPLLYLFQPSTSSDSPSYSTHHVLQPILFYPSSNLTPPSILLGLTPST